MPTRNVNLTEYYDQFVEGLVSSGRYSNASEVMRAGLRLLENEGREKEEKLAVLRALAKEGFDDLDAGRATILDGPEQLAAHLDELEQRAAEQVARRSADS
jgi:antitoxin ParD1/3/4